MTSFYKIINVIFVSLMSFAVSANAEDAPEPKIATRTFQLSFITPFGTNGWDSWDVINNYSFNLLTGYAAGVDGGASHLKPSVN